MARPNQHIRQVVVVMTLLVGLLVASNNPRDSCDLELEKRTCMMRFATDYTNDAVDVTGIHTDRQEFSLKSSNFCLEQTIDTETAQIDKFNSAAGCEEKGCAVRAPVSCRQLVSGLSPNAMERGWGTRHAAVSDVREVGMLLPSRIVWALHVGCDR